MTEPTGPFEVAVVGSGAVGALVASSAAAADHRDTLCVRSSFDRLIVTRDGRDHLVDAAVVTDPRALRDPADVVALTVKAHDTSGGRTVATAAVRARHGGGRPAERLGSRGPPGPALADGNVHCGCLGVHRHRAHGSRARGPPQRQAHRVASRGQRRHPRGGRAGHPGPRPELRVELVENWTTAVWLYATYQADGTSGSSMFYDRLGGRPPEHEALTDALVTVAHRHGIPVPLNEALLALLRVIDPAAEVREGETAAHSGGGG